MKNRFTKYDAALILFVIVTSIALIVYNSNNIIDLGSREILIYSDNNLYGRYTLDDNYSNELTIQNDGGYNIVKISNGYVCITEASCNDKLCVKQGKINKEGQILVCLPNKLLIKISATKNQNDKHNKENKTEIDSISQ